MAKLGPRLNTKSGKLIQMFPDFSGGLNTIGAIHQVEDNEFVDGQNVDIDELGSVSKRPGCTQLPTSPSGTIRGIHSFKTKTARRMVAVAGGKLYKLTTIDPYPATLLVGGTWDILPVRLYKPDNVRAVLNTTNSTLTANAVYEYKVVAKDTTGMTKASEAFIDGATNVSRVTLGATPKQVVITWDKVLGASAYDLYRATVTGGVAGAYQKIKAVGDVVTWTDTGADAPDPGITPPAANTTSYTLIDQDATFVSWNDRLYLTAGNGLVSWNGTDDAQIVAPYYPTTEEISVSGTNAYISAASSIHKCRFVKIHWNRLFLCGDADYPQNVYFTDLGLSPFGGEYAYFQGSYAFDVTTDHNEPITGVANFRDALVFFTKQSIHTLFGKQPDFSLDEAFTLRLTNNAVGCQSHKSIVTVHNSLVFVSMQGIYALVNVNASDTNMNVQYLSHRIEPTFQKLGGSERCAAVFHNHQYKVSFPDEKVVLRWYVSRQAWTLDYAPTLAYTQFLVWDTALYASTADKVCRMGYKLDADDAEIPTYSDNGESISFMLRTKSFDLHALMNLKKIRSAVFIGKQYGATSTAHVDATVDYDTQSFDVELNESTAFGIWTLGTSNLGWVDVIFRELAFKAKGHQVHFIISNDEIDEPLTMYGLGLEYKIKPV